MSSVGISTSPISSCRPYACTRCSSDSRTLFSNPEYVWMMYQFFVVTSVMTVLLSPTPLANFHHQIREADIDDIQVNPEEHRRQDDDQGRRPDLGPRRPRHAAELAARIGDETARAAKPAGHLIGRLLQIVQHRCRHHSRVFCLAGQEGIEPPALGFGD